MNSVKMATVTSGTIEIILSHNYPLAYTRTKDGFEWVITKGLGCTKTNEITHMVGMVTANDLDNHTLHVFGGPFAGIGLSPELGSRGINKEALAKIPWNYIITAWLLEQQAVPIVSEKHGRFSTKKTKVVI